MFAAQDHSKRKRQRRAGASPAFRTTAIFAYTEVHCQHRNLYAREQGTKRRVSRPGCGREIADFPQHSHTFDVLDHIFARAFVLNAVKLFPRKEVCPVTLKGPESDNVADAQGAEEIRRPDDAGQVLTFDEIDNLTAESGKPAETL